MSSLLLYLFLREVAASGATTALKPTRETLRIAPGMPPLLAFRELDGRRRGRFGGLDLVLDDAGH